MDCPCKNLEDYCLLPKYAPGYSNEAIRCNQWPPDIEVDGIIRTVALRSGLDLRNVPRFDDIHYRVNKIEQQVKVVKEFLLPNFPQKIMLYSPVTGTGKTHCLLSLYFEALKQRRTAYYIRASHLWNLWLYQRKGEITDYDQMQLDRLYDAEIKIIDEIGAELKAQSDDRNYWYENNLAILLEGQGGMAIATNLNFEEMPYQDGRVFSRLKEFWPVKWPANCKDMRGIGNQVKRGEK